MNSRIKVPTCTFVNSTLTSLIQLIIKFSFKNRCDAILDVNQYNWYIFSYLFFNWYVFFSSEKKYSVHIW